MRIGKGCQELGSTTGRDMKRAEHSLPRGVEELAGGHAASAQYLKVCNVAYDLVEDVLG